MVRVNAVAEDNEALRLRNCVGFVHVAAQRGAIHREFDRSAGVVVRIVGERRHRTAWFDRLVVFRECLVEHEVVDGERSDEEHDNERHDRNRYALAHLSHCPSIQPNERNLFVDDCLGSLLPQFLAQVIRRHQRMAERHARSGIAHDCTNALLRFTALAVDLAILAIALMPERAGSGACQRGIDGLATLRAEGRSVFRLIGMMRMAVDASHCLEYRTILILASLLHERMVPHGRETPPSSTPRQRAGIAFAPFQEDCSFACIIWSREKVASTRKEEYP